MVTKLGESMSKSEGGTREIKCLILCSNELLGEAVENLCKNQAGLNVVNIQRLGDSDLMQEIERHKPDVLILDEGVDQNIRSRLLAPFTFLPNILIILLGMQANVLQVYRKQIVPVTQNSDLISIILDQPTNP